MKIKSKFGTSITSILVIILTFLTYYLINDQREKGERNLQEKLERTTELIALTNEINIWNIDLRNIKKNCMSFLKDQEIQRIVIRDDANKILFDNGEKKSQSQKKYYLETEVKNKEGSKLGKVAVTLTDLYLENNLTNVMFNLILVGIIAILLISILIIIVTNIIISPLKKLTEGAIEISKDNFDVQLDYRARDEIGLLTETFNDMVKQIKANRENLKEQERLKKEMELAQQLQTSLLPRAQEYAELEIAAAMLPADEVGGDFYDIAYDKSGHLWLGIGDVSGHGVTPGLIMMMTQTIFTAFNKSISFKDTTTEEVFNSINEILFSNLRYRLGTDHFMTLTLFKYLGNGLFNFSGAHLDILIYRNKTNTIERIPTEGVWLNLIPVSNKATTLKSFQLEHNDTLFLYTDGIIEANNIDAEKKGEVKLLDPDGLIDIIKRNINQNIHNLKASILNECLKWSGNIRKDDMSIVVARRKD